jgi:hypothetical protein
MLRWAALAIDTLGASGRGVEIFTARAPVDLGGFLALNSAVSAFLGAPVLRAADFRTGSVMVQS